MNKIPEPTTSQIQEEWIDSLLSGKYKQLFNKDGEQKLSIHPNGDLQKGTFTAYGLLSAIIAQYYTRVGGEAFIAEVAGLKEHAMYKIGDLNDDQKRTFREIGLILENDLKYEPKDRTFFK